MGSQWEIVDLLKKNPGGLTSKEISAMLGNNHSCVTNQLRKLRRFKGLVTFTYEENVYLYFPGEKTLVDDGFKIDAKGDLIEE